jgi:hypothetical protein
MARVDDGGSSADTEVTGDSHPAGDSPTEGATGGCSADAGTGAVGSLGCACAEAGAVACAGNAGHESIICSPGGSGLTWQGNGACNPAQRCDTASGPNQGTCQTVVAACADAAPGTSVCSSSTAAVLCGPDLVTSTNTLCNNQACVSGACSGVCAPGSTQCSSTSAQETCNTGGTWDPAFTCDSGVCLGAGGGLCTTCPPNAQQCVLDAGIEYAETCADAGQGWLTTPCKCGCNAGLCGLEYQDGSCPPDASSD